ncbi:MAG: glycosyltransferase [candidate division NC10 bacterium]
MRVALFTNNYLPFCGGVTISVETLRRGLEAAGHEAWVFAPRFTRNGDESRRVVRYPSIPAATYPEFALAVPYSRRIARLVAALDFDVFHAHHPFLLGPAARRLARRRGRPLVFTYHTRYEKYAHYVPLPLRLVEAAAVRLSTRFAAQADAVIAPSAVIRDELQARGVRAPIAVVPTGVDLGRFRPGDRRAARVGLGVPDEAPLLLYAGRLDREKSVDRVLLAFERVASTVAGARLLLVGQGTEGPRLRRLAAALPVSDRIRFLGVRAHEALAPCYQAADVFVFASETETQGLVLAEAAACGLPAVAVSAPGCDEVVRDGETGVLTKHDPSTLGDAVIGLLLDGERRRRMGRRARQIAEREFDVRLQIERTLNVYAEAAERCRTRLAQATRGSRWPRGPLAS